MKGIVFIKFMEMVEAEFGDEVMDNIIENSTLPSGGVYTSVGYYSHEEMVALTLQLSEEVGKDVPWLLGHFGYFLFSQLYNSNPDLVKFAQSAFDLIGNIESVIHPEVLKLYPDAELPRFEILKHSDSQMHLLYTSSRHFEDLCEGLLKGCLDHFKESASIEREEHEQGTVFILNKLAA